jgi:hypothetical protein
MFTFAIMTLYIIFSIVLIIGVYFVFSLLEYITMNYGWLCSLITIVILGFFIWLFWLLLCWFV